MEGLGENEFIHLNWRYFTELFTGGTNRSFYISIAMCAAILNFFIIVF